MKKFSGKRISKKTFTIFVGLAVIVFMGFLFYSFYNKSNLFEGQTTNTMAPATSPGKDENVYSYLKGPIDEQKQEFSTYATDSSNVPLQKLAADTIGELDKFLNMAKLVDDKTRQTIEMIDSSSKGSDLPGLVYDANGIAYVKLADPNDILSGPCPDGNQRQRSDRTGFSMCFDSTKIVKK